MKVEQKDARILREGLSKIYRRCNPQLQREIIWVLRQYAEAVVKYCDHNDRVFHAAEGKEACLDCGRRSEIAPPKADTKPQEPLI